MRILQCVHGALVKFVCQFNTHISSSQGLCLTVTKQNLTQILSTQTQTHHTCHVGCSYLFKAVCVLLLNKVFASFCACIVIHSRYYSSSLRFGGQIWVQCIIIWEMKQWKTLPLSLGSPRRNDSGIDILKYINRMALPFFLCFQHLRDNGKITEANSILVVVCLG